MNVRQGRIARNQVLYRAVNQEIERVSEEFGDERLDVLCECGRSDCREVFPITASEYDKVRAEKDRFVVAPGHATSEIERVVKRTEQYEVVDKFGEAEDVAEHTAGPTS